MTESTIYKKCLPLFKKLKAYGFRIENTCGVGVPDAFFQGPFFSLWVEFKQINTGNRLIIPGWRPGQLVWARRNIKFSGKWCLIISVNEELFFSMDPKLSYTRKDLIPLSAKSLMQEISKRDLR